VPSSAISGLGASLAGLGVGAGAVGLALKGKKKKRWLLGPALHAGGGGVRVSIPF
jgi:hypothetical protein